MKLVLVSMMRVESRRAPRKLLQEIEGRSMAEIALSTLKEAAETFRVDAVAAVGDDELVRLADSLGVEVFYRSEKSLRGATHAECFDGWREFFHPRWDIVLRVNACQPFISIDLIGRAVDWARRPENVPFRSTYVKRGGVWNSQGQKVVSVGDAVTRTTDNEEFFTDAHTFYCYRASDLGNVAAMYRDDPGITVPEQVAFFDVDTIQDLTRCRIWAAGLQVIDGASLR